MHACFHSFLARGLSIDSRAYVISLHARWPSRTPRPTFANQDAWVVITPKRPKSNSIHTAAWHAWARTPPLNIVQKAVFALIHFPASFILPSCHSDLEGSRQGSKRSIFSSSNGSYHGVPCKGIISGRTEWEDRQITSDPWLFWMRYSDILKLLAASENVRTALRWGGDDSQLLSL